MFADTIKNPLLQEKDIEYESSIIYENLEELENNAEYLLPELLHSVAYRDQGLGRVYSTQNFTKLNRKHLIDFMENHYVGENLVISACGVDHEDFVQMISKNFSFLPKQSRVPIDRTVPIYYGGEHFQEIEESEYTNIAIVK